MSKYEGEWMSELLPVSTGNTLCVTLSISVQKQFAVLAKLFSRAKPRAVYKAETTIGGDSAMDLFSMFEVQLHANDGDLVQLVIYVSRDVAIKTANMSIGQCPSNSMYLIFIADLEGRWGGQSDRSRPLTC